MEKNQRIMKMASVTPQPWRLGHTWWLEGVEYRVVLGPNDEEVAFASDADAEAIVTARQRALTEARELFTSGAAVEGYAADGWHTWAARAIDNLIERTDG